MKEEESAPAANLRPLPDAKQFSTEELFTAFMTHLPGVAWIKDLEGRYLFANPLFFGDGPKSATVLGKSDQDLWPSETAHQFRQSDQDVLQTGHARQTVEQFDLGSGANHVLVTKFPIRNQAGKVVFIGGIGVNVTELVRSEKALRESEERSRKLVDLSPNLIGVAVNARVAFINSAGARMLGARRPEELLGMPVLEFVHPSFRAQAAENIRLLFEAGKPVRIGRETWLRIDGCRIEVEISAFPFTYQNAPAIYIVGEDVSERIRSEKQLQQYTAQLQALSQRLVETQENERRHIARELHDHMGQTITAIQLNLQNALQSASVSLEPKHLAESLRLLEALSQQAQDLSLSLRPSMLDDLGLEATLRWLLRTQTEPANLRTQFSADPLKGRLEPAIEIACFRVTQECLTNVVRHARAKQVSISLRCEQDELHLAVRDDGIGFDPAARTGPSLGLIGMQERIALVGGRFHCQSAPEQGTQIHAWFPLKWSTDPVAPVV